jgi:hypothetical protein
MLPPNEHRELRDFENHSGWLKLTTYINVLLETSKRQLLKADTMDEVIALQTKILTLEEVLRLPKALIK